MKTPFTFRMGALVALASAIGAFVMCFGIALFLTACGGSTGDVPPTDCSINNPCPKEAK